jgi:plastocyanin
MDVEHDNSRKELAVTTGNSVQRTTHATTQILGLGLITVALLIFVVVILILGDADALAFIGPLATVAALGTFVVWRYDRLWARIVGLVATLGVTLLAFWLAFGVFQPFSPIEFIAGLAFFLGVVLALYGGIATIVAGSRGTTGPTRAEGWIRTGVVVVMSVASVISIVGFFATRTTVSAAEAAGATPLSMSKVEFVPPDSTVSAGGSLFVSNDDPFAHDFTLDDLDLYVYVGPGSETIVDLAGAAPGTYTYYCSLHSDGTTGMVGTITIEG